MGKDWMPYNITTESGKELWTRMNHWHGSSVWGPVGEGIVEIEKEVTERIIALIENKRCSENEKTHNCMWLNDYQADDLIAAIKGETNEA